jgi:predicted DNA-binding protein (MmcQ/YjbR family)
MVILRATSNLGGQKEDKRIMCSITLNKKEQVGDDLKEKNCTTIVPPYVSKKKWITVLD